MSNSIQFIRDYEALTRLAERTPEAEALAQYEQVLTEKTAADAAEQESHARTQTLRARHRTLADVLTEATKTAQSQVAKEYETAILAESDDLRDIAGRAVTPWQYVQFLRDVTHHLTAEMMPLAQLAERRAEAFALLARATSLTSEAIFLAVKKNAILQQLIAVDGEAAVTPTGRAWEALCESLIYHERAAKAHDAALAMEAEITARQSTRNAK